MMIAVRGANVAGVSVRQCGCANFSKGAVSQPAASSQKKATVQTARGRRAPFHSTIAAKKSANKVNRINLNAVTYVFRDKSTGLLWRRTGCIASSWTER